MTVYGSFHIAYHTLICALKYPPHGSNILTQSLRSVWSRRVVPVNFGECASTHDYPPENNPPS